MFRNIYKQAMEEIKGDRSIIDRAFLQAAAPKKKSCVMKYSVIGTAVTAVVIMGAIFANPSVFTNRSEEIRKIEDKAQETTGTEAVNNLEDNKKTEESDMDKTEITVLSAEDKPLSIETAEKAGRDTSTESKTVSAAKRNIEPDNDDAEDAEEYLQDENDGIMVMSLFDDLDGEPTTEYEPMVYSEEYADDKNAVYGKASGESLTGASSGAVASGASSSGGKVRMTEEAVGEYEADSFSYEYDMSVYRSSDVMIQTEGFVNADEFPITNAGEAIERAKLECSIEYDTVGVQRDYKEDMWKVRFSVYDIIGASESVYIDAMGITKLIVYGE